MYVVPLAYLAAAVVVALAERSRTAREWTVAAVSLHFLAIALAWWKTGFFPLGDAAGLLGASALSMGIWTAALGGRRIRRVPWTVLLVAGAVSSLIWVTADSVGAVAPMQAISGTLIGVGLGTLWTMVLLDLSAVAGEDGEIGEAVARHKMSLAAFGALGGASVLDSLARYLDGRLAWSGEPGQLLLLASLLGATALLHMSRVDSMHRSPRLLARTLLLSVGFFGALLPALYG